MISKAYLKSLLGIIIATTTSCAGLHSVTALPSVSLDRGNFKYVRHLEEKEETTFILGIGGMSKKAREENAYNKMVEKADLLPNQAIANVSFRKNVSLFFPMGFFVTKVNTIVSGDVVEFMDGTTNPAENPSIQRETHDSASRTPSKNNNSHFDLSKNESHAVDGELTLINNSGEVIATIDYSDMKPKNFNEGWRAVRLVEKLYKSGEIDRNTKNNNTKRIQVWIDSIPMNKYDRETLIHRLESIK